MMRVYTQEELEKMTQRQLKAAKVHFYKKTKRLGLPVSADELAYLIRLKAELIFRRV